MTKIVLIGAGRLGLNLGKQIIDSSLKLVQVYSRNIKNAKAINSKIAIDNLDRIKSNADLYIVATPDDTILDIAQKLVDIIPEKSIIVHVSGTKPSTIFEGLFKNYGSFYPLQTFSKEREVNFYNIPICCTANTIEKENFLRTIAQTLSNKVYIISDSDRASIHVSAVFVNNFTNLLFQIGSEIMNKEKLPFEILMPLIEETFEKIKHNKPKDMQTGPAIRGDKKTILKHLDYLKDQPNTQEIYKILSKKINPRLKL